MLLSCSIDCMPRPSRSVLVFTLLQSYVGCGSSNQPYLLNSHLSAILYCHRAACFLFETGDNTHCQWLCFNGGEWTDRDCSRLHRRAKLTTMQMVEKSHLSHAWQCLSAPEVYLVLFHSLPLNCSYASLQLGHSLTTFTVRSDTIQRLRPLAKRLGIPLSLCVKPNTAPE